jgi:magnesium-transporting ATPase (P-type)
MFYKNILYVVPIWYFGFYSSMSQTPIYNALLYNFYNLCFTALPIVWFAVYDWEHSKEALLANPKLYKIGLNDVYFNKWVFWRWFATAVAQGIAILIITFDTLETDYGQDAGTGGIWLDGTAVFTTMVFLANLKVILRSYEWTFWMFFFGIGSTLFYIGFFWMLSEFDTNNLFGIFQKTWSSLNVWLLLLFFLCAFSIVEWGITSIDEELKNQR